MAVKQFNQKRIEPHLQLLQHPLSSTSLLIAASYLFTSSKTFSWLLSYPTGSTYGICTYILLIFIINKWVKYTIPMDPMGPKIISVWITWHLDLLPPKTNISPYLWDLLKKWWGCKLENDIIFLLKWFLFSLSRPGPWNKRWNGLFSLLNMESPKVSKVSHWSSKNF